MIIKVSSKRISIPDVKKVSDIGKIKGLMFCFKENSKALLFEFRKPVKRKIHSLFVFFPFLCVWMDKKNNILEKRIIDPWKISVFPKKPFHKLLEIPINKKYRREIVLLSKSQKDL